MQGSHDWRRIYQPVQMMAFDLAIIGAGPSGLCLAKALSGKGLHIALIEQQSPETLSSPLFDGREIALTHHSAKMMKDLDIWRKIDPRAISPLRDAKILNGKSDFSILLSHQLGKHPELGFLISNHLIRKAAFDCIQESMQIHDDIDLFLGQKVVDVKANQNTGLIRLEAGTQVHAKLIVAADSRFSATRRMMGIAAQMHDFGKNMLVCCMTHEKPHHHTAWEWFDYGQTLALLPMNSDPETGQFQSSIVITVDGEQSASLMGLSVGNFSRETTRRFGNRLGEMQLVSTVHSYPLISVYPRRLVAQRFATIGDAAVGMHPVTAHGFNFGLLGVQTLSHEIIKAHQSGLDIGNHELLARYQRKHRIHTRPLFLITRLITDIYTNELPRFKLLRNVALHIGERFMPFKKLIALSLSGSK